MTLQGFFHEFLGEFLSCFLLTLLAQNMVFSRALGASTAMWVVSKRIGFVTFGIIFTIITASSSIALYYLLPTLQTMPNQAYLLPLVEIVIIGCIYIAMLLVANRLPLKHKNTVRMFIHRSAFNSTVLGTMLLLSTEFKSLHLIGFIGFSLGSGIGFMIAIYLIKIAYARLYAAQIPPAFRGFPILLFYLGVLSLAIYGMIGHELPL